MKKFIFLAIVFFAFVSCKKEMPIVNFAEFGETITSENAISKEELLKKYQAMNPSDTLNVKVATKIIDVCQKKGCWMNLDLGNNESTFVKFKDYGFFVPLNAAGSEVVVNGKAYIEITPIEDLKEYAKDAGKSPASIDSIMAPEKSYAFMADGVLIKK